MKRREWKRRVRLFGLVAVMLVATFGLALPAGGQAPARVSIWFLGFNTTQPPFSDVLARRAVATAIDRARMAAAAEADLAAGVEPPGCLGHNANARLHPYNPQVARELLAQSGFKADEAGELGLWVLSFLTRGDSKKQLEILTANLSAIGLPTTVRQFGNYNALQRIATLSVVKMSYWGIGWNTIGCSQETFLEDLVHSSGDFNYFGYRNPDVDALIDRARRAGDRAARAALFREAEQKILDDAVIVPIWWFVGR